MLSISNVDGLTATRNEALRGIKRSRFSLHLNTARRRRWLLVQLVTAPAIDRSPDEAPHPAHRHSEPDDLGSLYRQYEAGRLTWSAR